MDSSLSGGDNGGDSDSSERLEDTPAEKHKKAAEDSESKQARTQEQETNPVSSHNLQTPPENIPW